MEDDFVYTDIPPCWLDIPKISEPGRLNGVCFFVVKPPLPTFVNDVLPDDQKWGPAQIKAAASKISPDSQIYLINLEPKNQILLGSEFENFEIQYSHIKTNSSNDDQEIREAFDSFCSYIQSITPTNSNNQNTNDSCPIIFLTDRLGYTFPGIFLIYYLVNVSQLSFSEAFKYYSTLRDPGIFEKDHIQMLARILDQEPPPACNFPPFIYGKFPKGHFKIEPALFQDPLIEKEDDIHELNDIYFDVFSRSQGWKVIPNSDGRLIPPIHPMATHQDILTCCKENCYVGYHIRGYNVILIINDYSSVKLRYNGQYKTYAASITEDLPLPIVAVGSAMRQGFDLIIYITDLIAMGTENQQNDQSNDQSNDQIKILSDLPILERLSILWNQILVKVIPNKEEKLKLYSRALTPGKNANLVINKLKEVREKLDIDIGSYAVVTDKCLPGEFWLALWKPTFISRVMFLSSSIALLWFLNDDNKMVPACLYHRFNQNETALHGQLVKMEISQKIISGDIVPRPRIIMPNDSEIERAEDWSYYFSIMSNRSMDSRGMLMNISNLNTDSKAQATLEMFQEKIKEEQKSGKDEIDPMT